MVNKLVNAAADDRELRHAKRLGEIRGVVVLPTTESIGANVMIRVDYHVVVLYEPEGKAVAFVKGDGQ